jgi:hypothetical protein
MHDILHDGMVQTQVVELRQYTLHPGARETLITLFDERFIEGQEQCGISVIGQFRDLDRPNRFVWLRGFSDMATRADGLAGFYDGPVWADHRDEANATMVDSDDVLLLKPSQPSRGFALDPRIRPPRGTAGQGSGLIAATILHLNEAGAAEFPGFFERMLRPVLARTETAVLASFITEPSPNNFPRLPVREGETVFVWFAGYPSIGAYRGRRSDLMLSVAWRDAMADAADLYLKAPPGVLRLEPTAHSLLRA